MGFQVVVGLTLFLSFFNLLGLARPGPDVSGIDDPTTSRHPSYRRPRGARPAAAPPDARPPAIGHDAQVPPVRPPEVAHPTPGPIVPTPPPVAVVAPALAGAPRPVPIRGPARPGAGAAFPSWQILSPPPAGPRASLPPVPPLPPAWAEAAAQRVMSGPGVAGTGDPAAPIVVARVAFPAGEARTGFDDLDPGATGRTPGGPPRWIGPRSRLTRLPGGLIPASAPERSTEGAIVAQVAPDLVEPSPEPEEKATDPEKTKKVDLPELKGVDIKQLVKIIAEETQTNYYFEDNLVGSVTILGPRPITVGEAEELLKTVLEYRDYGIVLSGSLRRIVPKQAIKGNYVELRRERPERFAPTHDHLVLQVFRIRHTPLAQVAQTLTQFFKLGPTSLVQYAPTNTLFVIDTDANLGRIAEIVDLIDQPLPERRMVVVRINHTTAKVVADKVGQVLGKLVEGAPPLGTVTAAMAKPALLTDERTNSILLVCLEEDVRSIVALIEQLDAPEQFAPSVRVIHLVYAEAEQVAGQVGTALGVGGAEAAGAFKVIADARTQSLIVAAVSPKMIERIQELVQFLDNQVTPADGVTVHHYRMNYGDATKVEKLLANIDQGQDKKSPTKIISDEATNSLVILSSKSKYQEILNLLGKIDTLRPQVFVEVLLVDFRIDKQKDVGADFNLISDKPSDKFQIFGLGSTGAIQSGLLNGISNGAHVGVIAPGANKFDASRAFGQQRDLNELLRITYLINLFKRDNRANILSAPRLLTADNEEAKINVGEKVQIPTGVGAAVAGGQGFVTNFTTEELGLSMTLKPRITKQDFVSLKFTAEIKDRTGENLVFGALFQTPVFKKTSVESNVTVKDHTTIVIGGLITEQKEKSVSKIPILGDIPIVGRLFQNRSRKSIKKDLLIFLTPHIIRDAFTARHVTAHEGDVLQHRDLQSHTHPHERDHPITPRSITEDLKTGLR